MNFKEIIKYKDQLLISLFTVLPLILLGKMGEFIIRNEGTNQIIVSSLFGGLGGILGFGTYYFVRNKNYKIKFLTFSILFIVVLSTIRILYLITKPIYSTCEICGYKGIKVKTKECQYCGNFIWEVERKENFYNQKKEWIRDGQLFWFRLEKMREKKNFYKPLVDDGFEKDIHWKPLINQKDLELDFKE